MKEIIYITLIILFFLLFLPLAVKIKFFYSLLKNNGFLEVILFKNIKLLKFKLHILNGKLILTKKSGKVEELDLKLYDPNLVFYNELQKAVLRRIIVKKFFLTIDIGIKDNVFLTGILSGYIQMLISILFSYLSIKNNGARTITQVNTNFKKEQIEFIWHSKIYVSTISIFLGILEAFYKKNLTQKKVGKNYGRQPKTT